jgi:AcrR family transcriptional regulator
MNRIVKSASRTYDNTMRTEQAAATRDRIIDAAVRVLSRGADKLSVPAVAEEATVSVPTVYRHFGTKTALVDAVYDCYADRVDVRWADDDMPADLDDYLARIPNIFARHESVDPELRIAMSGPEGAKARREHMPERLRRVDDLLADLELSSADRSRLRELLIVLTSSAVQRAFREYLGLGPDVAADRIAWAIRRLTTPTTTEPTTKPRTKRRTR